VTNAKTEGKATMVAKVIRADGTDIALELRESSCDSEACADGCGDHIACRVWVHEGREHTEPPAAMVVDPILRHVDGSEPTPVTVPDGVPYEVPQNLRRFFAGRTGSTRVMESPQDASPTTDAAPATCCTTAEQDTCCASSDKRECCGAGTEQECGCR